MEIIGNTLLDIIRTFYTTWKDEILVTLDQSCEVWRSRLSLNPNNRYRLWGKQVSSVSLLKLLTESGAGRWWEAERWGILIKGWVGSALESRVDTGDLNWNKKFVSFLKKYQKKKHERYTGKIQWVLIGQRVLPHREGENVWRPEARRPGTWIEYNEQSGNYYIN